MDLIFNNIYKEANKVFNNHTVNLSIYTWLDAWAIGLVCLKAVEFKNQSDKKFILPHDNDLLCYFKRMHFDELLDRFTYNSFVGELRKREVIERENSNIHEILYCEYRDVFDARLSSKIRIMFKAFGLNVDDGASVTALVGELGNNVFDHNAGQWPTDIGGAIILAQHNPNKRQIEVVVADPGIGFIGSLKIAKPSIKNDIDAIKLGLSGVTGRIDEKRGDGLRIIQDWTINKFNGMVKIHSGSGLVVVDKEGQHTQTVFPILGTLASFVVKYKI